MLNQDIKTPTNHNTVTTPIRTLRYRAQRIPKRTQHSLHNIIGGQRYQPTVYTRKQRTATPRTNLKRPNNHAFIKRNVTAERNPSMDLKENVMWNGQDFILDTPVADILSIKHAALEAHGSPWPLPQKYTTGNSTYIIDPHDLHITIVFQTCGVLEFYLRRVWKHIFGDERGFQAAMDGKAKPKSSQSHVTHINTILVSVLKPCTQYPSLTSNEQCKYSHQLPTYIAFWETLVYINGKNIKNMGSYKK